MYGYMIIAMVDKLVDSGLVRYQDKQKAIDTIGPYWDERIANVWGVQDVIDRNEFMSGNPLTRDQAREVLENVFSGFDAEIGINWSVIDARIEEYKHDNKAFLTT